MQIAIIFFVRRARKKNQQPAAKSIARLGIPEAAPSRNWIIIGRAALRSALRNYVFVISAFISCVRFVLGARES